MSKIRALKRNLAQIQQVRKELSSAIRGAVVTGWQAYKPRFADAFQRPARLGQQDALVRLAQQMRDDIVRGVLPGSLATIQTLQQALGKAEALGMVLAEDLTSKTVSPLSPVSSVSSETQVANEIVGGHLTRFALTVATALGLGRQVGGSFSQAQKALKEPLIQAQARLDVVATTEVFSAHRKGVESIIQRDPDIGMLWLAVLEGNVCPFCLDRHGNVYRDGDVFVPIHPQCQCILVPVTREDLGPEGFYDQAMLLENELWTNLDGKKRQWCCSV